MANQPSAVPRPHDLLWGFTSQHLADDAPGWASVALAQGAPVVVRRAIAAPGWVAVGVRGQAREQRLATWMRLADIDGWMSPESVAHAHGWANFRYPQWPAVQALAGLAAQLNAAGLQWGVTGSLGFELASGLPAAHPQSDLDLLIRTPQPLSRARAQALCDLLKNAPCAVDVQLETPLGAVALREWAKGVDRVLLKSSEGPQLVSNPWLVQQAVA